MANPRRPASYRPPKRRARRPWRWLLLALAALAVFVAGLYLGSRHGPRSAPGETPERVESEANSTPAKPERTPAPKTPRTPPPTAAVPRPAPGEAPTGERVTVALVIDDLGRSVNDIERLRALEVPISYAVLPFESRTREVLATLRETGAEVLVHLPMEPSTGADPGPGALTLGMTASQLASGTRKALEAVPGATGVNNHMGSTLSADAASMRAVLAVIAEKQLFFLDSRTSPESVAYQTAMGLGVPAAERQVFLDNDRSVEAIRAEFRRWLELAASRGSAIAIGHPYPETLQVLAEEVPRAVARGVQFVPVSYLMDRSAAPEN